ncbi:hypothetical protein [Pseudonocardia sp. HH130630-07]|uniref:hypothetical protein n=1 Tax=Pseudonocardia sp. HH130630-07 TaxID=1690815 RepID=UPI00081530BA|nr:hypothetical protein [Pseudonocardia sp. HH130630-07]ANY06335.1 hypothetical protein AFB00_08570 [Pseudonocardia sp. HH130630-07]
MDQDPRPGEQDGPARGGVVLAGPPGSGRRTLAFALTSLRRSYAHVPGLTTTPHPLVDAEQVPPSQLAELRSWAALVHESTVGGTRVAHDRERADRLRAQGRTPVVCVADADALVAFTHEPGGWLTVLLHCPRDRAEQRLRAAGHGASLDRRWSRRWEQTAAGLHRAAERVTLALRSDRLDPLDAARLVHLAAQADPPRSRG